MTKAGNKEAIQIASAFFQGNIALNLGAIGILVGVGLMKLLPIVGIVFAFAYPILSFAVQIFVARAVPGLQSPESMAQVARESRLGDLFTRHLDIAAGGFLGFFSILMILTMIFMGLMSFSVNIQGLQSGDIEAVTASIATSGAMGTLLLFLLVLMALGYLMPGVMGEVLMAEDFVAAFRKSFLLFSPRFWKRSFNRDYFLLVLVWSVVVFVAALLISWIAVSILLLPVALVGVYFLSLYNAVIYVFAREALRE